jgi:hypothetical protein
MTPLVDYVLPAAARRIRMKSGPQALRRNQRRTVPIRRRAVDPAQPNS